MGAIDDITANGRISAVAFVGIGALLLVLGGFAVFHLLVDDGSLTKEGQSVESVVRFQTEEIATLKDEIRQLRKTLDSRRETATAAEAASRQAAASHTALDDLRQRLATAETKGRDLAAAYEAYRGDFRARSRGAAVGEKIPVLVLKSGRRYENATITRVTDAGLEISFADGLARIPLADLDSSWHKRFDWSASRYP